MNVNRNIKAGGAAYREGLGRIAGGSSLIRRASCALLALGVLCAWASVAVAVKPPEAGKRKIPLRPTLMDPKADRPDNARANPADAAPLDPNAPRPRLTVDNKTHDFGTVWIGPDLKHTYKITNEGDAPLEIKRVKPSCGCTVAGAYPKTIEPGETGEFPFSVKSTRLRGNFVKSIAINTNDPDNISIRLMLKGSVKQYVEVVPPNVYFGKLHADEPTERVLKISNNTETPLELTASKEKMKRDYDVEVITKEPGELFELHVTAKPPFPEGPFREYLVLNTNIPEQQELKIDVRGTVPQTLEVNPKVLSIGQRATGADPTKPIVRVVRLTNYGRSPVKLLSASVDDPAIKTEINEPVPGKSYTVEVKFPADYTLPDGGRLLTLRTDDKGRPQFSVPIKDYKKREQRARPAEQLVGKAAPDFNLTTVDGKEFSSSNLNGAVTVVDFFAPNCGFCKKQIPRLDEVREKYADKGVRFVAVSQTMRNKKYTDDQVKQLIDQLGFKGELVLDPSNSVGPRFKATSYPTMIVIGKEGKVDHVNLGNMADLEKRLTGQLDALLGEKVALASDKSAAPAEEKPAAPAKPTVEKKPAQRPQRADGLIGQTAPKFEIEAADGQKISSDDFTKNAATVLNFVATNCGYCGKQIPRVEKLRQQYEGKGVKFVNIVETMRKKFTKDQVAEKMKTLGSKLQWAHDEDNKIGPLFSARGFPTMVVVGKSGNVEAVNIGNMADLEKRMTTQLDAIIAGKPVPKIAARPPAPRKRATDLVGQPAPKFATETLDGKKVSSDDFANHPATVLNFVATNCGYCSKQIPRIEKLREQYESKGVRFVNMVQTMRKKYSQEDVVKKMTDLGSKLELVHDVDNKVGPGYGARGFPTMVIVGKSGKIEAANIGNIADLETRLTGQLDALIEGKPVPKFAAKQRSRRRPAEDLVGKPAPSFTVTTMDGKTVTNASFKEHPATVLNFVAPNCGFCKRQLPNVEKVRSEYEAKGVRFVNVVQKMRKDFSEQEIIDVLKGAGSRLEVSTSDFASNTVGQAFKAVSFPTMFVINKAGNIAHVNIGAKQNIDSLLKGQLDKMIK